MPDRNVPEVMGLLHGAQHRRAWAIQSAERNALRPDSHTDLERVRIRTLLVCGHQDPVTPVHDHEAMAARVPGARLEIIENCGHQSTIEQPEIANRVLENWLQDTEADSVAR